MLSEAHFDSVVLPRPRRVCFQADFDDIDGLLKMCIFGDIFTDELGISWRVASVDQHSFMTEIVEILVLSDMRAFKIIDGEQIGFPLEIIKQFKTENLEIAIQCNDKKGILSIGDTYFKYSDVIDEIDRRVVTKTTP